jgi:hypothetical protein
MGLEGSGRLRPNVALRKWKVYVYQPSRLDACTTVASHSSLRTIQDVLMETRRGRSQPTRANRTDPILAELVEILYHVGGPDSRLMHAPHMDDAR